LGSSKIHEVDEPSWKGEMVSFTSQQMDELRWIENVFQHNVSVAL
jgi:hypothetical protein